MNLRFRIPFRWIATLTLLTLIASCSTQNNSQSTKVASPNLKNNSSQQTPLSSKSIHNLGERVSIKDKNLNLQFTVNGTREHPGKGVIKPNRDHKWIVVDMTIANKGQESKTFSVISFEVTDSKNKSYEVALLAGALEDIETPTGEIIPGKERRGELAFEVPEGAKELKLNFKPNSSECDASTTDSKTLTTINCEPIVINLN
ncbi:MAG TPA: DUF4352 domain-containing protein [Cyanobacteria bacterium UBA12227]|nr:DUF4352 domain-containing protein [Cyanobacteria bacterium UBA12227]HAX85265.1 DUF4352 domain-containing protein [Cyanobacteria bacterium UBA11370]